MIVIKLASPLVMWRKLLVSNKCAQSNNILLTACFSSKTKSPINIFNRKAKTLQKDYAALIADGHIYDYLREEIGYRVADRVYDIKRRFPIALDIGCHKGFIGPHLSDDVIDTLIYCDSSKQCLLNTKPTEGLNVVKLNVDEEHLPLRDESVDLVVSSLSLHWVNDLASTFNQIFSALKSDGVFIASMFGGQTLFELRCSLQMAENEREGGFGAHISPFVQPQDLAGLLNRSGFTMVTIDCDEIKVNYPTMFELMNDLKGMAENNVLWNRKNFLSRDTLIAASAIYDTIYGNKDHETHSGSIPATFHIYYLIGWKPHESQQKPIERGTATFSLKDIANLDKILKK